MIKTIPYNYETDIHFLTRRNTIKAPGNKISFGLRTYYDNGVSTDLWYSSRETLSEDFLVTIDGGYFLRDGVMIFKDPSAINNHTVQLYANLLKNQAIGDTLSIPLDYVDQYECTIQNFHTSRNLQVYVDVYYENLIDQELMEVTIPDSLVNPHRYLINTHGGSIKILSHGRQINVNYTSSALPYSDLIDVIYIPNPPQIGPRRHPVLYKNYMAQQQPE